MCSKFVFVFVLIFILCTEVKSLRWFEGRVSRLSFPIFHFPRQRLNKPQRTRKRSIVANICFEHLEKLWPSQGIRG